MHRPHRRKTRRQVRTALAWCLFSLGISWLLIAGVLGLTDLYR
jgi:hypothetical protein